MASIGWVDIQMTKLQIVIWTCGYLVGLVVVIYFTRPTVRRIAGAFAGGATAGAWFCIMIAIGEAQRWWHVPMEMSPSYLVLFYLGAAISCAPIFLLTWRIERRFRWRGVTAFIGLAAIIGPPRDYTYARLYPEWITFSPGIAPVLGVSVTYASIVGIGHAVMRLVSGPSGKDAFAERRRVKTER
jgi:hypothetical protein